MRRRRKEGKEEKEEEEEGCKRPESLNRSPELSTWPSHSKTCKSLYTSVSLVCLSEESNIPSIKFLSANAYVYFFFFFPDFLFPQERKHLRSWVI